jgi:hypothetical protein
MLDIRPDTISVGELVREFNKVNNSQLYYNTKNDNNTIYLISDLKYILNNPGKVSSAFSTSDKIKKDDTINEEYTITNRYEANRELLSNYININSNKYKIKAGAPIAYSSILRKFDSIFTPTSNIYMTHHSMTNGMYFKGINNITSSIYSANVQSLSCLFATDNSNDIIGDYDTAELVISNSNSLRSAESDIEYMNSPNSIVEFKLDSYASFTDYESVNNAEFYGDNYPYTASDDGDSINIGIYDGGGAGDTYAIYHPSFSTDETTRLDNIYGSSYKLKVLGIIFTSYDLLTGPDPRIIIADNADFTGTTYEFTKTNMNPAIPILDDYYVKVQANSCAIDYVRIIFKGVSENAV